MKAKDYFNQFLNENKDKTSDWRLVNAFRQMFIEVGQIAQMRNAKSNDALIAIFKEVETKSHLFIKLVNEVEPFKSEGSIKYDAFRIFIEQSAPELSNVIWKS